MDSRKAEKFERHRKEVRKKAFLNISIVILAATGLAFYIGGYAADFLFILFSAGTAVIFSMFFIGILIVMWSAPLLHYREKLKLRSDKERGYYRDRDPEETPLVKILEGRGWKKVESGSEKVVLETYPTIFHRVLNRKTSLILEEVESEEDYDITVLKTRKKEISRIKTEFEEADEGLEVTETTVSRSRVSPIYIEVTLYLMPELQELTEEAAEEKIEVLNDKVDYGIKQYELE